MKIFISKLIPVRFSAIKLEHVRGTYRTPHRMTWWEWRGHIWAQKKVSI